MKLLVIGRTASGKDALARCLSERGVTFVTSNTTRPKRSEDDDSHFFVSEETYLKDKNRTERIFKGLAPGEEDNAIVAHTVIDGYHYYALKSALDAADAYVIDPEGAIELMKLTPEIAFRVIYVKADADSRLAGAMARADDPQKAREIFESREVSESPRFDKFEADIEKAKTAPGVLPDNCTTVAVIENDYSPLSLERTADWLADTVRTAKMTRFMIEKTAEMGGADITVEDDAVGFTTTDGETHTCPIDLFTEIVVGNPEQMLKFLEVALPTMNFSQDLSMPGDAPCHCNQ